MNELFSIAGKVAVITGAGGVLGGNIAQHFVQQGAKVVAIDIRQEQLDNRVAELKQYGDDVIGIIGNVLDIASLEKVAEKIVAKWGTDRYSIEHCRWQYAGSYSRTGSALL